MDGRFAPGLSSIFVTGVVHGPSGRTSVRMALDTGTERTVIRASVLRYVGYDLTGNVRPVRMTSATGVQRAVVLRVDRLEALGRSIPLPVVAHELPASFDGHGLLGRDFFAGLVLTIDFAAGTIRLRPPRPRWPFWR